MFCSLFCERTELIPTTAENINRHIASFKGEKAVLVNIWALWCAPCIEEFPMIVDLQKKTNCTSQCKNAISLQELEGPRGARPSRRCPARRSS